MAIENAEETKGSGNRLRVVPITLQTARAFIAWSHRHPLPAPEAGFAIGASTEDGTLVGVVVAGRPVLRELDGGLTIEVTRPATDGTGDACPTLLRAAWAAAQAMGYRRLITYIRTGEPSDDLRSAGLRPADPRGDEPWPDRCQSPDLLGNTWVLWQITSALDPASVPAGGER